MSNKKLRVVVIGTGNIAGIAARVLQGMECSVGDPDKPEELAYDGYLMTVMRIVNAIPYVCAAPAGITTFRDLPLTTPSNAFRSDTTYVEHRIMKANTQRSTASTG